MKNAKNIFLTIASLLIIFAGGIFSQNQISLSPEIAQATDCPEDNPNCEVCDDAWACNYDEIGACDYSCDCTDPTACNYRDRTGACEYTSCIPKTKVCGDESADNFAAPPLAAWEEYDDSVCIYYERGCSILACPNYDRYTQKSVSDGGHVPDDNLCAYIGVCTTEKDADGIPYKNYQQYLGSCDKSDNSVCQPGILGCMTVGDPNYNAKATYDDGTQCAGSCQVIRGICCLPASPQGDPYVNFVPVDDRQDCDVCTPSVCRTQADTSGCTDPAAVNYNASATTDDGSCLYNWCKYDVTFEKEDATYDNNNASPFYQIQMKIRVLLADYGLPAGKHPQACQELLETQGEALESDLNNIIEVVEELPIIEMTCSTCTNIIITNIPDLCPKIDGVDDPTPQLSVPEGYNRRSDGNCYSNNANQVYCGTASQPNMTFMNTTDIQANQKCNPTNAASTAVTRKPQSPTTFQWSCTQGDSTASCTAKSYCSADGMTLCDGICISSPNTCGNGGGGCVATGGVLCGNICLRDGSTCSNIPNPTFIENVKVNPKVIRNDNDKCIVTWNTVKTSPTDVVTCTFDTASNGVTEVSDGSWKRTNIEKGDHTIACTVMTEAGTGITDTATARCSENPKFIEF